MWVGSFNFAHQTSNLESVILPMLLPGVSKTRGEEEKGGSFRTQLIKGVPKPFSINYVKFKPYHNL